MCLIARVSDLTHSVLMAKHHKPQTAGYLTNAVDPADLDSVLRVLVIIIFATKSLVD